MMSESRDDTPRLRDERRARRPYEPPRVLSRERLEALAVLCSTGKVDGGSCPAGPIQS